MGARLTTDEAKALTPGAMVAVQYTEEHAETFTVTRTTLDGESVEVRDKDGRLLMVPSFWLERVPDAVVNGEGTMTKGRLAVLTAAGVAGWGLIGLGAWGLSRIL